MRWTLFMRIAFYPCCGSDLILPLRLLNGLADRLIFCDLRQPDDQVWRRTLRGAKTPGAPSPKFVCSDATKALRELECVHVLFYRNDSTGEGGSALRVWNRTFLLPFLERLPDDGGLIVTDGSNCWPKLFRRMNRPNGVELYGWHLQPERALQARNHGVFHSKGASVSQLVWLNVRANRKDLACPSTQIS